jgi:hypothetical protein
VCARIRARYNNFPFYLRKRFACENLHHILKQSQLTKNDIHPKKYKKVTQNATLPYGRFSGCKGMHKRKPPQSLFVGILRKR